MKRRELIRHLSAHGCALAREGSDHSWWGNAANGRRPVFGRELCHVDR
ncbi:MAG: type II toxin-antitoxin system HicA family toxin [Verrucomicrobia bacterium]|nr:type II toxin-antitoxin system HicA family toxin [Verrucomicrobiota bacterium]